MLVNRVRELQSYTPRIEELEDNLRNPVTYEVFRGCPYADALGMFHALGIFVSTQSFDTNGNLVRNTEVSTSTITEQMNSLGTKAFTIDEWKIILESFFEVMRIACDPAAVEIVQAFDTTAPMSDELVEVVDEDPILEEIFNAKMMLKELRDKKAAWTLEIEDLRRELDHMGDKILALIADLSLNR